MKLRAASVLLAGVWVTGCWVTLEDPAGRACDADHPCRRKERCVLAHCSAAPVDGWSQGIDGFDLAATQRLPRAGAGRIAGRISFPDGVRYEGKLSFVQAVNDSGARLVNRALVHEPPVRALHLEVAPNVLQVDPVLNGLSDDTFPAVAQLLAPGVENEVAVAWEAGLEIRVFVNGTEIFQRSLQKSGAVPEQDAYARELRLGHSVYE